MQWIALIGASEQGIRAIRTLGYACGLVTLPGNTLSAELVENTQIIAPSVDHTVESIHAAVKALIDVLGSPRAIVSFTELGLWPAAAISFARHLPTNTPAVIAATRNKAQMREQLRRNKRLALPYLAGTRRAIVAQYGQRAWIGSSLIKPLEGFGSQQIHPITSSDQFDQWSQEAPPDTAWIVEPLLDGPEYSVEAVTHQGSHYILGVTAKQVNSHFVEVGHAFPAPITPSQQAAIEGVVREALSELHVTMGASHTEVIWDRQRGPVVVETHTRPGGDHIPELVQLASGYDQYALAIASCLAEWPPWHPPHYRQAAVITYFTLPPGYLHGLLSHPSAGEKPVRVQIDVMIGERIRPLQDSFSRVGYVLCTGTTVAQAQHVSQTLTDSLHFDVKELPLWP
ncbi:ATP-grasp domain-containing protein [Sulfobacillus sp. hq2]|uniref:ATP-grasp domain-containing protein n=1 Tax=Sulfobacillus TaxID=28033 RepID=UPI001304A201|nr:ATP-grasp domain-containing protein [Sulfobacillus sp. hq2]